MKFLNPIYLLVMCLLTISSFRLFAGNPDDLTKFAQTGDCVECDLSGFKLSEIVSKIQENKLHARQAEAKTWAIFFGPSVKEINLKKANLQGVDLVRANLEKANLSGANLSSANLRGAILKSANFTKANLRHANLNNTNLALASFEDANLENTYFHNASFNDTSLKNANLRNTRFVNANFNYPKIN